MRFTVGSDGNGVLLRSYLKKLHISGKQVAHLKGIENGIQVNGEHVTVRFILHEGDIINLDMEDKTGSEAVKANCLPISVLYEDNGIVVCNKPPFMPTHPSHGHYDDTLANALAYYYKDKPFVFRPVNRLDRNTSGVVMVAKDPRSASVMYTEMLGRRINKEYIAVVDGEFSGEGMIEKPLRRTKESIIVREVCQIGEEGAQYAKTEYRVLAFGNGMSTVILKPLTGRTHQLRVHLASIGHPIVGDDLYGKESSKINRQALHALSVVFNRNYSTEPDTVSVTAPIPDDMAELVRMTGYIGESE